VTDRLVAAFAGFIRRRSDADLDSLMHGWRRRPLLWAIFRLVPRRFDREAAAGEAALIEVRVADRRRDRPDRRQLLMARGRCAVSRHGLGEPDSVVSFDAVAFLRFVAGQQRPRDLFLGRRMSVDGSLFLAAELPSLFRLPGRPG
jgi:predicted lipid carrier protein YhbT